MTTKTVKARKVREGDFLTGLDNGYVFEPPTRDVPPYVDGRFVTARPDGYISINFHTVDGDEGELIVPDNMPVTVERRSAT